MGFSGAFGFHNSLSTLILPEYADNAAALLGGLKIGDLYRTGDLVKVVH
jgi:hypothetical protein